MVEWLKILHFLTSCCKVRGLIPGGKHMDMVKFSPLKMGTKVVAMASSVYKLGTLNHTLAKLTKNKIYKTDKDLYKSDFEGTLTVPCTH